MILQISQKGLYDSFESNAFRDSFNLDFWCCRSDPSKSIPRIPPHIPNDGRTETGNAGSTLVPHTRINQADRTGIQQFRRQALRRHIAIRCKTGLVAGTAAYIMKRTIEIRQKIVISYAVVPIVNLRIFDGLMPRHFLLGRLQLKARVPGAAIRAVEAAAARMRVREGGIDDAIIRHGKDQLVYADPWQQVVLGLQPVVRGIVEIENDVEMRFIVGD